MFDRNLVSFFILIDNCHFSWSVIYEWVFRALVVVGVTSGSLPDAERAATGLEKRLCWHRREAAVGPRCKNSALEVVPSHVVACMSVVTVKVWPLAVNPGQGKRLPQLVYSRPMYQTVKISSHCGVLGGICRVDDARFNIRKKTQSIFKVLQCTCFLWWRVELQCQWRWSIPCVNCRNCPQHLIQQSLKRIQFAILCCITADTRDESVQTGRCLSQNMTSFLFFCQRIPHTSFNVWHDSAPA